MVHHTGEDLAARAVLDVTKRAVSDVLA